MTVYTCIESAGYSNKETQKYMSDEEVWNFAKLIPTDNEHVWAKFEFDASVEVLPIFKQKVQIFWRPEQDGEIWTYKPDAIDMSLLQSQVDKVDSLFPELRFMADFRRMHHHASCNYDPYMAMY